GVYLCMVGVELVRVVSRLHLMVIFARRVYVFLPFVGNCPRPDAVRRVPAGCPRRGGGSHLLRCDPKRAGEIGWKRGASGRAIAKDVHTGALDARWTEPRTRPRHRCP